MCIIIIMSLYNLPGRAVLGLLEIESFVPFDAITCTAPIITSHIVNTTGVLAMFPREKQV